MKFEGGNTSINDFWNIRFLKISIFFWYPSTSKWFNCKGLMPPIIDVLFRNHLCLSFQMIGTFLKFERQNTLKKIGIWYLCREKKNFGHFETQFRPRRLHDRPILEDIFEILNALAFKWWFNLWTLRVETHWKMIFGLLGFWNFPFFSDTRQLQSDLTVKAWCLL